MMAAAYEGKTVKQWLMDLARGRLAEMEKKGIFRRGNNLKFCMIRMKNTQWPLLDTFLLA